MIEIGTPANVDLVRNRIIELQLEHRGLDALIDTNGPGGDFDDLALRRLKKRRLQIRDEILALQMQLVPDIPA
ncbi:MAG: YdcH family protein [Burkholderiaceae bacterium]